MQFGILGPLEVRSAGGDPIAVGGPRPRALLVLLLLEAGRTVGVDRLIDAQYGESPPAGAANAVQAQISRLRRNLPADLIEFHGAGYRLAVPPEDVDAHRFERLARDGRRLLAAGRHAAAAAVLRECLDLWRGPALADVREAAYAPGQADRLEELRLAALEDLYEADLHLPEAEPAAGLRELVAAHPLRERPRALLMRALHAAGRQAEALAVYDEARRLLADELGADPSPELAALHLAILRGEQRRAHATRSAPPPQLTSFVGREEELARLAALRGARLVTITGPGGTGKTRLAVEAATRDRERQACFADLSPAAGEGQVPLLVLNALGLRESALSPAVPGPADPAERLVAALAEQDLLLILDNCEHIVAEAATLARRLLAGCPGVRVLATSREPLGITGEHLVPLPPLGTPPPGTPAGDALAYPAVRLFADRAAAVRPGLELDLDATLSICAALDGLPLAIELAAARVRTFPVAEIAARLAEHGRFRLLSRGDRTAAARHRTLHAVVEWSWDLLDAEEQVLARRFSVFSGGARLEAVERVCGEDSAVLLADLVDKSLVETAGDRYRMLDTVRLFCAERLAEAGEEERMRAAHAAWHLEHAQRAEPHLYRAEQLEWLALLGADDADLQAALRWSVEHDQPAALRLIAALAMYWYLSGRRGQAVQPARRLLDVLGTEPPAGLTDEYVLAVLHAAPGTGSPHWRRAAELTSRPDQPVRHPFAAALWGMTAGPPERDVERPRQRELGGDPWSRALGRLGEALLLLLNGGIVAAERELEIVLAEFGALGERWGKAQGLDWLAVIAGWRGEWARATELWAQALDLLDELGALDELVDVLCRRADARLRAGDLAAARADCLRARELARGLGRPELTAAVHVRLGDLARIEGDLGEAAERLRDALTATAPGSPLAGSTDPQVLTALARLAQARGEAGEAVARHREAVAVALRSPIDSDLADAVEGLAGAALLDDPPERAALLLGVGVALRGTAVTGDHDVAATAAAATAALGPDRFAALYARGAAMTRDEARSTILA
ncbi:BTAD domain-containing putative transcriptional regulator [Nonomuraea sp. NPDC001636]|uniref:BTAD domain-containing putative transcriptional regulator n=1 Tax=Nonomuraea sp. NPDC001636 TaxID=3154391 RepID=UPI003318326B